MKTWTIESNGTKYAGIPGDFPGEALMAVGVSFSDGDVGGLDADGHLVVFYCDKHRFENTGDTMEDYGIENLSADEKTMCYMSMNVYTKDEIDEWLRHYLMTALWSSHNYDSDKESENYNPDASEMLDGDYDPDDVDDESKASCREDIVDFIRQCTEAGIDLKHERFGNQEWSGHAQHAHDLWLTRNGHGAGFWDRGYPKEIGDKLTEIAHGMGSKDAVADGDKVMIE